MKTPKNWSEVTLNQYYNLLDAISLDWETKEDKAVAMLSALTSISIDDLESKIPIKELSKALNDISFIGEDKPSKGVLPSVKLNGRRFAFDLVLRDSAASTFIDLSEYCKDPEKTMRNIHKILAVFMYDVNVLGVRKDKTLKSQEDIAEYLKDNLTMDIAFGYSSFFLTSYKRLLRATLSYLDKTKKRTKKMVQRELEARQNL